MSVSDKLLASGQELVLAIFAAKGASLVCFPAGTEVHTGNGLMFIEDIAVGTMVWTVNEANGQRELKPITQTHRRTTLSMMVVELENGTIFEVTPEHRFLVNEEWKEIQSISVLDKLELVDGEKITVKNIGFIGKSAVVYNFDILDNENYFVTEDGVLVHNGYQNGRLPKTKGEWIEGTPGNGLWKSSKAEVNAITKDKPIPFKNGRPDFSEWKVDEFKVNGMNGTKSDFSKIHEKLASDLGLKNKTAAEQWLKDNDLTAHHLDNNTIQLISSDLHNKFPHVGNASDV